MTCWSVAVASALAWPLKPTCVSLICTKLNAPAGASAAAAGVTTRDDSTPPAAVHTTAAPVQANVGSVATLTGNPQNMLVGSFSSLTYRAFLVRQAPIAVVGLVAVFAVVWLVYRRALPPAFAEGGASARAAVHYPLMVKTLIAVGVMLVAFLAGVPIAL